MLNGQNNLEIFHLIFYRILSSIAYLIFAIVEMFSKWNYGVGVSHEK